MPFHLVYLTSDVCYEIPILTLLVLRSEYAGITRYIPWRLTPHDGVIKWKHFPRNWPFVRRIERPVTQSFDVFFDLRPNKRVSKQWWGWWFDAPSSPLWRHCITGKHGTRSLTAMLMTRWKKYSCEHCEEIFMTCDVNNNKHVYRQSQVRMPNGCGSSGLNARWS